MIDDMILDDLCENLIRRREMICRLRMRSSRSQKQAQESGAAPECFPVSTKQFNKVKKIASRGRAQVQQIDHALIKMARGQYGTCEVCHRPIAIKRLKMVPWTRYCIRCASTPANSFRVRETAERGR